MIEILVGLIIMFFSTCFAWTGFYLFDEFDFEEPPKIIKIIGIVEIILIAIIMILGVAHSIGNFFLN